MFNRVFYGLLHRITPLCMPGHSSFFHLVVGTSRCFHRKAQKKENAGQVFAVICFLSWEGNAGFRKETGKQVSVSVLGVDTALRCWFMWNKMQLISRSKFQLKCTYNQLIHIPRRCIRKTRKCSVLRAHDCFVSSADNFFKKKKLNKKLVAFSTLWSLG